MTTPEQEAEVIRLYYAEHWKMGTIAAQTALHIDTVRRILGIGNPKSEVTKTRRPGILNPYQEFILETLTRYPELRATRLYDMLKSRGYKGAIRTVRYYVAQQRPKKKGEVYLRTETMPGEQAQVDWAYVGKIKVEGGERALWLFVMVLAHSRAIWAEFVTDLTVSSLCRSLARASLAFNGVPRQWLFDNPKIVVLERNGNAVRFHPVLLDLCGKMRVQPRLCAVARPEHKGKVERSIRYLRDRFLAGRQILSVERGNADLNQFLSEIAMERMHPVQSQQKVSEVFAAEQGRLLPLPVAMPVADVVMGAPVDRQAFIRFDTNKYSVPAQFAENTLTLHATDTDVRLLDVETCVAVHVRCFGKKQIIEAPSHREEILQARKAARSLKGRDRLRAVAPESDELIVRWVNSNKSLALLVSQAIQLLDLYGEEIFVLAVNEINTRKLEDTGALAVACDRLRKEKNQPLPLEIKMPDHIKDEDVIPHDLGIYDKK